MIYIKHDSEKYAPKRDDTPISTRNPGDVSAGRSRARRRSRRRRRREDEDKDDMTVEQNKLLVQR
jgi:hypothetical protein